MATLGSSMSSLSSRALVGRFLQWVDDSVEFGIVLAACALVLLAYGIGEAWFALSDTSDTMVCRAGDADEREAHIERSNASRANEARNPESPFQPWLPPQA